MSDRIFILFTSTHVARFIEKYYKRFQEEGYSPHFLPESPRRKSISQINWKYIDDLNKSGKNVVEGHYQHEP
jgi:hypothetical protein